MPASRSSSRNLWALTVLSLLRERPMHPYEMQRQIQMRHKADVLALKRGSLYHAIEQMLRAGHIEAVETTREGRRPERTVYRLTASGEDELLSWLRGMVARPEQEPTLFTAALAHLHQLTPQDAAEQLEARAVALDAGLLALGAIIEHVASTVGRVSVLELEYALAVATAELAWIRAVTEDLRCGRLSWDVEQLHQRWAPDARRAPGGDA
jgi:DNA-binding PadR family transcriptional regulator